MRKLTILLALAMLVVLAAPATAQEPDIVDVAVDNGSFTTLVVAVTEADLVEALKAEGRLLAAGPHPAVDTFDGLQPDGGILGGDG